MSLHPSIHHSAAAQVEAVVAAAAAYDGLQKLFALSLSLDTKEKKLVSFTEYDTNKRPAE